MRLAFAAGLSLVAFAAHASGWPGQRLYVESSYRSPPAVYVFLGDKGFVPPVGWEYDFAWTVNGEARPATLTFEGTDCITNDAQQYSCDALTYYFRESPHRGKRPVVNGDPEAFVLTKADYDTEYCFRFRRQAFESHPDALFSDWTCARTPSPPPRPTAPGNPQATKLPAASGRGVPGPGAPFRALIEWDPAGDESDVLSYVIQRQVVGGWNGASDPITAIHQPTYEAEIPFPDGTDPDVSYAFRVCAQNISGATCSAPAHTQGRGWVDPTLRAEKAIKAHPVNESIEDRLPSPPHVVRAERPGASEAFYRRVQLAPPVSGRPTRPVAPPRTIGSPPPDSPPPVKSPICAQAQSARERNSPAAPSLEAQCRAAGGGR